jgi:hypothetical protein
MDEASTIQLLGAGGFGAMIGWYVYYVNRYRTGDVQLSDITTVMGVIGGGAVLALFPARTDLFGAYGIGLFVGFFSYFITLLILVALSSNFNLDWFLDGRRMDPKPPYSVPQSARQPSTAMGAEGRQNPIG